MLVFQGAGAEKMVVLARALVAAKVPVQLGALAIQSFHVGEAWALSL